MDLKTIQKEVRELNRKIQTHAKLLRKTKDLKQKERINTELKEFYAEYDKKVEEVSALNPYKSV